MFEKVKSLRVIFDSDDDDENEQSENLQICKKDIEKDSRLKEVFDEISVLDNQLRDTEIKRKEERRQRFEEQLSICDHLLELDKANKYRKSTKSFLDLYKRENEVYKFKKEKAMGKTFRKSAHSSLIDIKSEEKCIKKHKSETSINKSKYKKNFIAKNVKFASIYGIYHLSLSDEDKEKLLALLEDIDIEENEEEEEINDEFASKSDTVLLEKENIKKQKIKCTQINPFSFLQNDDLSIKDINKKLDVIDSDNWKKTKRSPSNGDNGEDTRINKNYFIQKRENRKRLKDIDKKILCYTDSEISKSSYPPTNEQLSKLIENCVSELNLEVNVEDLEKDKNDNVNNDDGETSKQILLPKINTPKNVIDHLLVTVKSQIPNFKYRYTPIEEDENKNK